jgi:tRNA (cytidine/uridine-2'-O-)-methyltransferase
MTMQIALVHPQIPPNTGQIARLCVATATPLHLVRPLGFRLDDRTLRRAGLDYWQAVDLHVHDSLEAFLAEASTAHCWLFTKQGRQRYDRIAYAPGDWLVFGSETDGLPADLVASHTERTVRIPIRPDSVRSLNLASAASIALYEALRQQNFADPFLSE